jgi:hypothetical protein
MGEAQKKHLWFYPARELSGPWLGVPGSRPPIWFGGDEFDRRTVVFQLPGIGAMVIVLPFQSALAALAQRKEGGDG